MPLRGELLRDTVERWSLSKKSPKDTYQRLKVDFFGTLLRNAKEQLTMVSALMCWRRISDGHTHVQISLGDAMNVQRAYVETRYNLTLAADLG